MGPTPGRPRVVVIGAGFGGLRLVRALRRAPVDVLLLDRKNHHAFQPLLYEVATAGLDPGDIAQPVRTILRGASNAAFRLADVTGFNFEAREVLLHDGESIPYDYLVIAAGSTTAYFGVDSARHHARGLKDLADAVAIRDRILTNFERAIVTDDPAARRLLTSIVVVGGGPTGVEMAGALAELQRHVLARDYPLLTAEAPPVLLIEATSELLGAMPSRLRRMTLRHLGQLGVRVRLDAAVSEVTPHGVTLRDGEQIPAANVIWVAGVQGAGLAAAAGLVLGASGRLPVEPTLQLAGRPEVFAIGDIALLSGKDGRPLPMLAPVALQQADVAAANIMRLVRGLPLRPFRYRDRGTMATIGRSRAVAHVFGLQISGALAWWLWLALHLYQIIGLRNRAAVLFNWMWKYVTYDRAHRVVVRPVGDEEDPG